MEKEFKDIFDFKRRVIGGTTILIAVKLILIPSEVTTAIILSRLLEPVHFGIYRILSLFIMTCLQISEWGLGAALIQKSSNPDIAEYRTVFALRLIINSLFLVFIWLILPFLKIIFRLPPECILMVKIFSSIFIIGTFSFIPYALLQRKLQFKKIAILQIISVLGYQIPAITLAFLGFKAWSLIIASIISAFIFSLFSFIFAPWKIGFAFCRSVIRQVFKFGSFFQLTSIVGSIRDNIIPVLGGIIFGPQAVGYLSWGYNSIERLSVIFHQVIGSVAFPSVSRIQDNPEAVSKFFLRSIRYLMLLTAPLLFILFALSYEVIEIIFTSKWIPALPALIIFGCLSLLGHFTTVGDNVLKGLGKVKEDFKIMSIWTILAWVISIFSMGFLGYNAIAFGWTISALIPAVWITHIIGKYHRIDFKGILNPLLAGALSAFLILIMKYKLIMNIFSLFFLGGLGLVFYLVILWILEGKRFFEEMLDLWRLVFEKSR